MSIDPLGAPPTMGICSGSARLWWRRRRQVEPLRTAVPVPAPALPISTPTLVIFYLYTNIFWLKQKADQNYGNQKLKTLIMWKKIDKYRGFGKLECLFFFFFCEAEKLKVGKYSLNSSKSELRFKSCVAYYYN